MELVCESRVCRVTVHARGALVTRVVALPDGLADGDADLLVGGLTPLADAGTIRAAVIGATRRVVAVHSALQIPATPAVNGATVERLRDLGVRLERLRAEQGLLTTHRQALLELEPKARLRLAARGSGGERVSDRAADALAISAMLDDVLARIDNRLGELDEELRALEHETTAARLVDSQTSSKTRMGAGHSTWQVRVRLAGDGPLAALELTYVVPAARWWPVYTLRFVDGGKRVAWLLEALVAQLSGEDWSGVELALSTADLVRDARLPELSSRRVGKFQPAPRRAFRAAPEGLDRLFSGYDRAFGGLPAAAPSEPVLDPRLDALADGLALELDSDEEETRPGSEGRAERMRTQPVRPVGTATPFAAAPMPAMAAPGGGFSGPPPVAKPAAMMARSQAARAAAAPLPPTPPPAPSSFEPDEGWLDYDGLTLVAPEERERRGRLARAGLGPMAARARTAEERIDGLAPGPAVADVLLVRGHFDHHYQAIGRGDIPTDGLAHRVALATAESEPTLRWRAVPREAAEVYKEAELVNPFAGPLLAGPADVYVEGSLLLSTALPHIDRGGRVTLGLGVEERVRIARNARVDEASAGLLGGATTIAAAVTIELTSALATAARVDVYDRIPISEDKGLEVELTSARPEAEPYTQSDRGAPIRGGLAWRVELPPGGKSRIAFQYRMSFSSKSELQGGGRRE